ncbi:LamG-like jellyroll fold domain-containing protein [Streptomyces sp. NPDC020607]|uniref:LamG-like jellyroll fold domain-containing protein n=1 Tax=Streptomyces sp. NPDC020607 TaxID=3365082 RepID=UPI0037A78D76
MPGPRGQAWRFDSDRDGVGFGGLDVAEPWTVSVRVRAGARTADQVGARDGAPYRDVDHSFDHTLPLDRWTRLTWVATPGSTTLYADGERVGSVAASIPLPLRSIGTEQASLRGDLDDLVTWDEAVSPAEVARLE